VEELIALEIIDPNPYQPREREDPEHIQKIADSIAADGLMQVPVGRRVDGRIQLAFGHSRLAACKLLASKGFANEMPVNVRELDDEEMFRQGISENLARKDLSPLETARAMARYRDEFKKTSAEIGLLFGLNEATVRGKIRLLNLPESVQESAANAPELVIRELVTVFDLPQDVQDRLEKSWEKPSRLAADAGVVNAAAAASRVDNMLRSVGKDMGSQPWKFTDEFPGIAGVIGPCKTCRYRLQRGGHNICLQPDCYDIKLSAGRREKLERANRETGIAIAENQTVGSWDVNTFSNGDQSAWESARDAKCPNLRLLYQDAVFDRPGKIDEHTLAFCSKRNGQCTCRKAVHAGIEIKTSDSGMPVTEEHLKEIARDARQQQRDNTKHMEELRGMAATAFGKAVSRLNNPALLRVILRMMGVYSSQVSGMSDQDVVFNIGKRIQEDVYNTWQDQDPVRACAVFNTALREIGLSELETPWTVSVETPEPELAAAVPAGKPLSEVFTEESAAVVAQMEPGETLIDFFKRTGQLKDKDETVYGPDCPQCKQPMPFHRQDEDGWKWYHCEKCDQWKGGE
jgi:ParB/RepB/Spo0J family partition protein